MLHIDSKYYKTEKEESYGKEDHGYYRKRDKEEGEKDNKQILQRDKIRTI